MEWSDQGVLLSMRKHGEHAAIIEVLTAEHGRHAGIVQGGGSRRMAPLLQPGGQVALEWRARLEDHLGSFKVEPIRSRAATIMADRTNLLLLGTISAMLTAFMAEREPHAGIYARTLDLLDSMENAESRFGAYVFWELELLRDLGFGIDLTTCAATGTHRDLIYISPRSGRAVSREAGAPYKDRMLPLPGFLFTHQLAPSLGVKELPAARARWLGHLERSARNEKV